MSFMSFVKWYCSYESGSTTIRPEWISRAAVWPVSSLVHTFATIQDTLYRLNKPCDSQQQKKKKKKKKKRTCRVVEFALSIDHRVKLNESEER